MLIDLLCNDNYISFNIKLAHIIGLNPTIYLAELMNINDKAKRKNKLDNKQRFIIDRDYIQSRTTFSKDTQKQLELTLVQCGILEKDSENDDNISLNIETLIGIMTANEETLDDILKGLKKKNSSGVKRTQRDCIRDNLKTNITCENTELKEAYYGWIDGVYANPAGFLSKRSIQIFQQTIDDFCNHDLDLALRIINIAAVNGYRDATWAINAYKKNFNASFVSQPINKPVYNKTELSSEVF